MRLELVEDFSMKGEHDEQVFQSFRVYLPAVAPSHLLLHSVVVVLTCPGRLDKKYPEFCVAQVLLGENPELAPTLEDAWAAGTLGKDIYVCFMNIPVVPVALTLFLV